MSYLDHHEFDLVVFKGSRRNGVARHLLDDRPVCEQVLLRLSLCREFGLQNAALPRVPVGNLKRHRLGSLADFLFGGLGEFPHTMFFHQIFARVATEIGGISREIGRGQAGVTYGPADLFDVSGPGRDLFGLREALRPVVRAGLRVTGGLCQHLAQLSLRLGGLPCEARFLPVRHRHYVGMTEGEVNPSGDSKNRGSSHRNSLFLSVASFGRVLLNQIEPIKTYFH